MMTSSGNNVRNTLLATVAIIVVALGLVFVLDDGSMIAKEDGLSCSTDWTSDSNSGTATSGSLFTGHKIRDYNGAGLSQLQFDAGNSSSSSYHQVSTVLDPMKCSRWAVVTTIFEPTEATRQQAHLKGWCLVVVGDKKGPAEYVLMTSEDSSGTGQYVFLTVDKQDQLAEIFPMVKMLPWNHFGRKNVGYLYAVLHGARMVWDFDDDNFLIHPEDTSWAAAELEKEDLTESKEEKEKEKEEGKEKNERMGGLSVHGMVVGESTVVNPYPVMGCPHTPCWPRGFPLTLIKNEASSAVKIQKEDIKMSSVGIIQSLADSDPDVDAMYRLTQPIPIHFPEDPFASHKLSSSDQLTNHHPPAAKLLLVPAGVYSPYNAQATLHRYPALWALLLPVTVHGRVSDIWRGYLAQKVFQYTGTRVLFSPPLVRQERNSHNILADLDSELPLYLRSMRLIEQLNEWQLSAPSLPGKIAQLWVLMYEHGYLNLQDVELCLSWLHALLEAGYKFPEVLGDHHPPVPRRHLSGAANELPSIDDKEYQLHSYQELRNLPSRSGGQRSMTLLRRMIRGLRG